MVLCKFGFPENFIKLLQQLYQNAETYIMINDYLSKSYVIHRGIRQGCPLSCLVFDLAIGTLAAMLQASLELRGFIIPGIKEKLITNLFADDISVFLSAEDRFADLE